MDTINEKTVKSGNMLIFRFLPKSWRNCLLSVATISFVDSNDMSKKVTRTPIVALIASVATVVTVVVIVEIIDFSHIFSYRYVALLVILKQYLES